MKVAKRPNAFQRSAKADDCFIAMPDGRELQVPGSPVLALQLRKHPIDHADVDVNAPVQAGVESVDESYRANVQGCVVYIRCTGAVGGGQITQRQYIR